MTKLNYPAAFIYRLINAWLDSLIQEGKLSENPENPVTRWDVGQLNILIGKAFEAANPHLEPDLYRGSLAYLSSTIQAKDPQKRLEALNELLDKEIKINRQWCQKLETSPTPAG